MIVLYLQIFNAQNYILCNSHLGFILKLILQISQISAWSLQNLPTEMQRRKARTNNDFIVTELKDGISSQKVEFMSLRKWILFEDRWIFLCIYYQFSLTANQWTLSQILTNHLLCEGVACTGRCLRHKHKHARDACKRHLFLNLKPLNVAALNGLLTVMITLIQFSLVMMCSEKNQLENLFSLGKCDI